MDFSEVLQNMINALKGELGGGFSEISAFVEDQGKLLAKQSVWIAESRVTGSLKDDDDLFEFFLDNLKGNTENLTRSIAMMSIITIEKAWNAVADALWGGLRTILSNAGVPGGLLPETPPFSF